ncbi:MAG: DciA family protein [Acidimicrobiia bacterium]
MTDDLQPLDGGLRRALARLGLRDVDLMLAIREDWDGLAGPPWAGASRPLGVADGELAVEAAAAGLVATLRYAAPALAKRLGDRLATDRIRSVRVVPPPRGGASPS